MIVEPEIPSKSQRVQAMTDWPKHLSPWAGRIVDRPTVSAAPSPLATYIPFQHALRLVQGVLTHADADVLTTQPSIGVIGDYQPSLGPTQDKLAVKLNGRKVVIAGGSIRDMYLLENPAAIKDIDVFILDCDQHASGPIYDALAEVMYALGGAYMAVGDYFIEKLRNAPQSMTTNVANVRHPKMRHPIQVMTTNATSVEELLDHFDWGLCKFAYDGNKFWFPGWKDVQQRFLTLNPSVTDPYWTLRRGVLLSEKYKKMPDGRAVRLRKKDVLALLSMWLMTSNGEDIAGA